jgi:hypothetical protein
MQRKALLKDGDKFVVLNESDFDAETALQEAIKRNPEVIPVTDLELGEVVVVGRETSLPAGAIDLLLVDSKGQIVIVETKLSRNPELRRQVTAQVLDYGASLWQTASTLREFEALVLRYWHSNVCEDTRVKDAGSLREGLEPAFKELCGEDWDYDDFETSLAENLANGRHILLVVASGLMDGLSRDLLQYLNLCLDVPLYGVEIDVFETEGRQLIVPRGVRYTAQARQKRQPPSHTDRVTLLSTCTPLAAAFFGRMLDEAEERGMIIYWGTKGFSVRMPLEPPISVMYGYPLDEFQVYVASWPLDSESQAAFQTQLEGTAPFRRGGKYTYYLRLEEEVEQQAYAALALVWDVVEKMMSEARSEGQP